MTEIWKLYRPDDPETSRQAAEEIPDVTRLEEMVADVILDAGPSGIISDAVRHACRDLYGVESYSSVTARYRALFEKGVIWYTGDKLPGASGRKQRVMVHKRYMPNIEADQPDLFV